MAGAVSRWFQYLIASVQERLKVTPVKTAAYTAVPWDAVMVDPSGGGFTVTLPPAAQEVGAELLVKNVTTSVNDVTLAAAAGETVEGASTLVIASAYGAAHLWSGSKRSGSASAAGWWLI